MTKPDEHSETHSGRKRSAKRTGITVRFADEQLAVVEEAAKIKGVTPSRFVREASIERGAHVVNSRGREAVRAGNAASTLADALFNPKIEISWTSQGRHYRTVVGYSEREQILEIAEADIKDQFSFIDAILYCYHLRGPEALRLQEEEGINAVEAYHALDRKSVIAQPVPVDITGRMTIEAVVREQGTEFNRLLLEEFESRRIGAKQFPKVDPARLISGDTPTDD